MTTLQEVARATVDRVDSDIDYDLSLVYRAASEDVRALVAERVLAEYRPVFEQALAEALALELEPWDARQTPHRGVTVALESNCEIQRYILREIDRENGVA